MRTPARINQILPIALIIMLLAFVSYKNVTSGSAKQDVCTVEKVKESHDIKVKSGVPIWESLSRHLITVAR